MREIYEISDRYIEPGDANDLLYEPVGDGVTFRRTRRYEFEFEGASDNAGAALERFVKSTLFDDVSQELHQGEGSGLSDFSFALDYGMKPGALDLEKEAVVAHFEEMEEAGFDLKNLEIRQRIYVFGESLDSKLSDRFIKDICNRAIHNWKVI